MLADDLGMEVDNEIEQYIEWLYDDAVESKIKAAKSILYLTISSQNLEYFAQHGKQLFDFKNHSWRLCQELSAMSTKEV